MYKIGLTLMVRAQPDPIKPRSRRQWIFKSL